MSGLDLLYSPGAILGLVSFGQNHLPAQTPKTTVRLHAGKDGNVNGHNLDDAGGLVPYLEIYGTANDGNDHLGDNLYDIQNYATMVQSGQLLDVNIETSGQAEWMRLDASSDGLCLAYIVVV
jgi:hypothetical protein